MMPHSTAQLRASLIRVLAAALLWLGYAQGAAAAGLTVAWNPNPEGNISRYVVSYGAASGAQSATVNVNASVTRVRIENLNAGSRYYLVVRAVNNGGQVSGPSSEVNGLASDVPPAAPAGSVQTYYAEGASGFFDYRVAVLNTAASAAWLNVSYLREGALPVARSYSVGAGRRMTISGDDVAELNGASFAAVISAPGTVISERTMRWRLNGGDGAAGAKALAAPSTTWYLAEGNAGFFDTFVLLANPTATPTVATVDFLLDGGGVLRRQYSLGGNARYTIWTNEIPELTSRSFATTVRAPLPILVERAMYFRGAHGAFEGGHASAAVPAGATSWFLAEGSTGAFFETFVLISNPNASAVTATIRYLTPAGVARTEVHTLAPTSRTTIPVDDLQGWPRPTSPVRHRRDRDDHRRVLDVLAGARRGMARTTAWASPLSGPVGSRRRRSRRSRRGRVYVLLANPGTPPAERDADLLS